MDPLVEELFKSLAKRISTLESEVKQLKQRPSPTVTPSSPGHTQPKGAASPWQLRLIKKLGGDPDPNLSMKDASDRIDQLKSRVENQPIEDDEHDYYGGEHLL